MQQFADITAGLMLDGVSREPDMVETFGPVEDWMLSPLEVRMALELAPPCTHSHERHVPCCEECFTRTCYHALIRKMSLRLGLAEEDADRVADEAVQRMPQ